MAQMEFTQRLVSVDWEKGAIVLPASAGEALGIGDVVYISGTQDNVGEAFKADADALGGFIGGGRGIVVAIAKSDGISPAGALTAVDGDRISVCVHGLVYGFTSLTPGTTGYVGTTAGQLVDTAPGNDWAMGYAWDATSFWVDPAGTGAYL